MSTKKRKPVKVDFGMASKRAVLIRKRYHQLEKLNHKKAWTTEEDMLAFSSDVGALARLVMAAEGRWIQDGNVHAELKSKMAECLWWILVLSDRLDIDLAEAFTLFIDNRQADLK